MQPSTNSGPQLPTANPHHTAHVPLAVYKELAAELQAAKVMVDSLNNQNQQLAKQNQQLRQEIAQAVQSVLRLQQIADADTAHPHPHYRIYDFKSKSSRPLSGSSSQYHPASPRSDQNPPGGPFPFPIQTNGTSVPETVLTVEPADKYRPRSHIANTAEFSSWGLALAILLMVGAAFGASYLIVRPLLPSR